MATADGQSDYDFDNDDTSLSRDDDSDNFLTELDSEKNEYHFYMTQEKKKWSMLSKVNILKSPQSLRSSLIRGPKGTR